MIFTQTDSNLTSCADEGCVKPHLQNISNVLSDHVAFSNPRQNFFSGCIPFFWLSAQYLSLKRFQPLYFLGKLFFLSTYSKCSTQHWGCCGLLY